MSRTGRFEHIVRSMTGVMDVPLTAKIRTGIYEDKNIAHTLVPKLRDWGVAMVTVSGSDNLNSPSLLSVLVI